MTTIRAASPEGLFALAVTGFGLAAESVNEEALGVIDTLDYDTAIRVLHQLRQAVALIGTVDASLARHIYLTAPHGDTEIDGIGIVGVRRNQDRKEWQHDDWKTDVRNAILDKHNIDGGLLFDVEGTGIEAVELLTEAQDVHGATSPKVTALRKLGLDPEAYCTSVPGSISITFPRHDPL